MLLEGKTNIEIIQETGASNETIRRINNGITFKDNNNVRLSLRKQSRRNKLFFVSKMCVSQ